MIIVPLPLSVIASVGVDRIGPTSAIAVVLMNFGGPVVLAVIQVVITSRTLHLGGTNGPVKFMNDAQLHALDHGYTYGLLWLAGVVILLGGVALLIGYTAQQVARRRKSTKPSTPRNCSSSLKSPAANRLRAAAPRGRSPLCLSGGDPPASAR